MGKYLMRGNYVGAGVTGLLNEGGSSRKAAATAAVESVGGSVDCMYYAFGDTDVFMIIDVDDDASAAALSLTANATGALSVSLTPLMTPEQLDDASRISPTYRPPGT